MDTEGHGYQAIAATQRFNRRMNKMRFLKSAFIHVHPWLMTASSGSNGRNFYQF
jgi:hypothetical protein